MLQNKTSMMITKSGEMETKIKWPVKQGNTLRQSSVNTVRTPVGITDRENIKIPFPIIFHESATEFSLFDLT